MKTKILPRLRRLRRCLPQVLVMLLALLLPEAPALAYWGTTGILAGRVTEKEHSDGLPGVQILLVHSSYGSSTDPDGTFHIGNVRAGVYDVRCSLVGYKTMIVKGVTVLPDLRNELNVTMEVSPVELEVVEVTAQQPLIAKDQPATAFSIGERKIGQLPVSTIKEIVALQPSTTVEGNIRGGKTNDVLYMIDGLPMQDVIAGGSGGNLPQSSISGLTILTGGYEAEYGNALAGVINVITRSAADRHTITARGEKDDLAPMSMNDQVNHYNEVELNASGPVIPERLSYFSSNRFVATDTRWQEDFRYFFNSPVSTELNGFEKLEYTFSPQARLSLQGVFTKQKWRDYEYSWRYNLNGLPPEARTSSRVAALFSNMISSKTYYTVSLSRFSLESEIGAGSKQDLSLQPYVYDIFLLYIIEGQRNWWADSRQTIWTIKTDLTNEAIDQHLFKVGFEFNRYSISSDVAKLEPQLTYFGKPIVDAPLLNYSTAYDYAPFSGSIFAQDKIQLDAEGSQVSFGLRWDFLNPRAERPIVEFIPTRPNEYKEIVTGTARASVKQQISPRIAISTSVDPATFVFVNFGQYLQFPLFDYLYSGVTPVQLKLGTKNVLTGNPDLEPERTTQWELGVKHTIGPRMVASATYFRKEMENQVDTKTFVPSDSKFAGDFGFAAYVNNASATSNGLELVISRENDERLSGSISYTYMNTQGSSEYADQRLNFAQWGFPLAPVTFPLSWDQQSTLKIDVLTHLPLGIEANLIFLYNSPRPYTFFPSRDGFTPRDSTQQFVPNNARMSQNEFLNVKIQKYIPLGDQPYRGFTIFLDGRNVLDRANIKWIDSNGKVGGELSDPAAYYEPRRVRLGFEMVW